MSDIAKSIHAINPSAQFKYSNEDFSTLTWLNGTTPILQSDIEAKQVELRADFVAKQYQRDREFKYPNWQEFAEAYSEKEIGGDTTKWDEYVIKYNKVRTDNPKS